jgi:hypothetical protein
MEVPKTYRDGGTKENNWRDGKQEEIDQALARQPYTATFDKVKLVDIEGQNHKTFSYESRKSNADAPVSVGVRDWLLSTFPDAWPHTLVHHAGRTPMFIGFNPRLFLKILGLECSLPENHTKDDEGDPVSAYTALPLSMWYGNVDHRDIESAVFADCKYMTWEAMLRMRQISPQVEGEDLPWQGPGTDVHQDFRVLKKILDQTAITTEE